MAFLLHSFTILLIAGGNLLSALREIHVKSRDREEFDDLGLADSLPDGSPRSGRGGVQRSKSSVAVSASLDSVLSHAELFFGDKIQLNVESNVTGGPPALVIVDVDQYMSIATMKVHHIASNAPPVLSNNPLFRPY
jgi:hypothetical protein